MTSYLWTINGKHYDFTDFVDNHPGGSTFIMTGKGRDCTELFYSVHQLSDFPMTKLLSLYEVNVEEPAPKQLFDFSEKSVFYHELRAAAKQYFKTNRLSHKADWNFWVFFTVYFCIMMYFIFKTITERNLFVSVITGILVVFYGFSIMHTGSHGGLSDNHYINWFLFSTYCNCLGWFHHVWLQHHVYAHHSYTGILGKDPDVINVPTYLSRKNENVQLKPVHRYNKYIDTFILVLFPSQFLAQSIVYFATLWKKSIFGMPIKGVLTSLDVISTVVQTAIWFASFIMVPIYRTGLGHLFYIFVFCMTLGALYWAFVETNHDTYEVYIHSRRELNTDWAIHQIIHSSNFNAHSFLTFLVGGMNYQIEHHLFPSVHPIHYPKLSEIVRILCTKHNVPYVMHENWIEATLSHFKFLDTFSK